MFVDVAKQNDRYKTLDSQTDINKSVIENKIAAKKNYKDHSESGKNIKPSEKSFVDCGKKFKNLKCHRETAHDNIRSKCHHCNKEFKNEYSMNRHIGNVHEKIPCSDCGRQIGARLMSTHMNKHEKRFLCNVCGKGFGTKCDLRDHTNIHNGEKPYVCKFCSKSFASFGTLRMHERSHEGHQRKKSKKFCTTK